MTLDGICPEKVSFTNASSSWTHWPVMRGIIKLNSLTCEVHVKHSVWKWNDREGAAAYFDLISLATLLRLLNFVCRTSWHFQCHTRQSFCSTTAPTSPSHAISRWSMMSSDLKAPEWFQLLLSVNLCGHAMLNLSWSISGLSLTYTQRRNTWVSSDCHWFVYLRIIM